MVAARTLARQIADELRWAENAVAGPDHPYLLTSPDVLVAGHGGLVAVFLEHAVEARNPRALATRQILSTLALPSHTRFVFVPREAQRTGIADTHVDWDLVVDSDHPGYIADALRDAPAGRAVTPPEVRELVLERAASAIEGRSQLRAIDSQLRAQYADVATRRPSVRVELNGLVAHVRGASTAEVTSKLVHAMTTSVPIDFVLDRGAVYPSAGVLGVHRLSVDAELSAVRTFDSLKLGRAAAFAGWTMFQGGAADSPDDVWTNLWNELDDE